MALMQYGAALGALLTALLVVYGIYALSTGKGTELQQRIKQYGAKPVSPRAVARNSQLFKDRSLSSFQSLDHLLSRSSYADRVALDLTRAAVPLRVAEYLLLRWVIAATIFLLAMLLAPWPVAIVLGVVGFFLPKLWVGGREKGRIKKFEDQLVDALTMMANALKSGSSFLQAMELVSRELPDPLAQEFAQVVAEAGVGANVDDALSDLCQRVRSYDAYLMVTAMTVQRSVGGNLSEVLDKIAHTIRERQRLLRQVQVETAEQRFSGYVLLGLPSFMAVLVSVINRPYIEPLFTENYGRLMLVGAIMLQIVGYLIMRKIADIKV